MEIANYRFCVPDASNYLLHFLSFYTYYSKSFVHILEHFYNLTGSYSLTPCITGNFGKLFFNISHGSSFPIEINVFTLCQFPESPGISSRSCSNGSKDTKTSPVPAWYNVSSITFFPVIVIFSGTQTATGGLRSGLFSPCFI